MKATNEVTVLRQMIKAHPGHYFLVVALRHAIQRRRKARKAYYNYGSYQKRAAKPPYVI